MPRLETKIPEYNLLGALWKNLRDDIEGHGIVEVAGLSSAVQRARQRLRNRRILKQDARNFINTPDFVNWAQLSGADPDALREDLLNAYLNS